MEVTKYGTKDEVKDKTNNGSNKEKNKEKKDNKINIEYAFAGDEFKSLFDAFVMHRKNKRKPLTQQAIQMYNELLTSWGYEKAMQSIKNTLRVGYPDLYKPKMYNDIEVQTIIPLNKYEQQLLEARKNYKYSDQGTA
jgi:hypothetical protein